MPGKNTEKDSRRAQILQAAYDVAARSGLSRLTVRLVAARAKLSTGLVLFYFKTKDRLLGAVLSDMLKAPAPAPAVTGIARNESSVGRLFSLIRSEMKRTVSEPRRVRLFFEYFVKGFRDPAIRAKMRAEFGRYRDAFRPAAAAVLASEPKRFSDVSAGGLAAVAVGVVEGGAVQSAIDPAHFDVDEYLDATKDLLEHPGAKKAPGGARRP
jgi:TetR/AcrR family transcriptional regulator, transcriptional repressor of bet genes